MLYTLFILLTGIYLGQEFSVIPSVKIIITNIMINFRGLPAQDNITLFENIDNNNNNNENIGLLQTIKRYLFW